MDPEAAETAEIFAEPLEALGLPVMERGQGDAPDVVLLDNLHLAGPGLFVDTDVPAVKGRSERVNAFPGKPAWRSPVRFS